MNVVSVMAHQDDELMCLGTMLKMQERGDKLHFICVTDGNGGMVQSPDMPRDKAAAVRDRVRHRVFPGRMPFFRYSTASPENGGVMMRVPPPATVPPSVVTPVAGLNHSTVNSVVAPDRLTVKAPVPGWYTRYSDPGLARQ